MVSTYIPIQHPTTKSKPAKDAVSVRRHAQAKRMISTKNLNTDLWLQYRQSGVGSSDASTAAGINPFKSQLELWLEKTGRMVPTQPKMTEDSPLTWGTILEPIVAEQYAKRTENKVRRVNAILQHSEHTWMLANLDREVVACEAVQILECKTAGVHSAKHWKQGVPDYIKLQVMHQLAVTGFEAADVAVLIGGQKLEIHRIHRDEVLIERLIELEQRFWQHVQDDTPPPLDASDSCDQALRVLYPEDNDKTVDLNDDAFANVTFTELLEIRRQLSFLKEQESLLKHRLQERMGEHSHARLIQGAVSWKQTKAVNRLDTQRLKVEQPELYERYLKQSPGPRRFQIHPNN
ncbi:MAG: YqaJ viral recombinase family protein [Hydrogenovibrio sp.]|uniref:YqaJ viral recombinase family nuclease n=1 Tax=Hydrogenovibrio sp. TaxID=2065821 RepID=UPI00286FFBD0|nr:YqaJ viral recombinase family protein [Hydrogenovibrio sp.]MDR9498890.1 YqaJ viral recombinase family protein [Hydrogenovibrio sp.]